MDSSNANLQPQIDYHQVSVDLDGLDDFLEGTPVQVEAISEENRRTGRSPADFAVARSNNQHKPLCRRCPPAPGSSQ